MKESQLGYMEKIKLFDSSLDNSVSRFNKLFPESPLAWRNKSATVEILDVAGPEYRRHIRIGDTRFVHSFVFIWKLTIPPERTSYDKAPEYPSNRGKENSVMTSQELSLLPAHYYLLQYLRGCQNPYHTYLEISKMTSLGSAPVQRFLREMEARGIVTITDTGKQHRVHIALDKEWQ